MDSLEREAKERKKKMIALATLPLAMGFFVWRLQTTTVAAPPPKAPPASVVAQAAPAVAAAAGPVLSLEKQRVVVVPLGDRDPFTPIIDVNPMVAVATPPSQEKPKPFSVTELSGLTSLPPANPMLRPFATPSPITAPPAVTSVSSGSAAPVAPPMPYVLSGIVKGNPDVAVLRHFDGSRRIVRAGESLDPKFRIASIQETSVVISGGGESQALQLGENAPAPQAKK